MAKLEVSGIVEDYRAGEFEGHAYKSLTVLDQDGGKIAISVGALDVKPEQVQRLMPIKLVCVVEGSFGQKGFKLKAKSMSIGAAKGA